MRFIPRLIPTLIAVSVVMLTIRIGLIWNDAGVAFAETAPAAKPSLDAAPVTLPKSTDSTTPTPSAPDPSPSDKPKDPPQHFSTGEIQVLQELSQRRAEIDQRADALDKREMLLKAAEQRVDEKIAKLQDVQQKLDAVIGKSEQADDERVDSLVRVYEAMKPAQAAAIFEGMDTASLLPLVTKMKDQKTALVLAAMAPEKARAVTLALAQRRELPEIKTN